MKCPVCKNNIPQSSLKCPYCKTRTGLLCSNCNTVNPVGLEKCQNCGQELLKICPQCHSVNFPIATECRKCNAPLSSSKKIVNDKQQESNKIENSELKFMPKFYDRKKANEMLSEVIKSKDVKIISITGEKGIGKTFILNSIKKSFIEEKYEWCIGKCTQLTQLTPGGVIQDMLLNLFKLPNFYTEDKELHNQAVKFFSTEFRFLNGPEILEFLNFLYTSKDGNYEDIIINKKRTFDILNRIFDAFANTGRFIFAIDNFDFIDGFSIEFFSNFIKRSQNWKNLKFVVLYNDPKPISGIFGLDNTPETSYLDVNLTSMTFEELENAFNDKLEYVNEHEKNLIFKRSGGNPTFAQQALSYCFDCQIADKAFILPNDFATLVKERLKILRKTNNEAYKLLCGASILGDRINLALLREIFGYKLKDFNDVILYLVKSNFINKYSDLYYEFNNLLLWETILKNIQNDANFDDINVKVGKAVSIFNINTNATMAMIAQNLKQNRMAFDIWTKTTRLASYIGDINLYVISQKQCLALINEFNDNETIDIRYNISERLGKLLTEYDPQEALEYLPDAISNAKAKNDEVKEIELLGYLALCCKKVGNYYGDIECVDNVLKKIPFEQELEVALVKSSKLYSLIGIGNCGEVVNLIDNDILPVLKRYMSKQKMNSLVPLGFLYDTWLRVNVHLASALAIQGNDRVFEILTQIFEIIEQQHINDEVVIFRSNLILAFANTMKGNYSTSNEVLIDITRRYDDDFSGLKTPCYELISIYNFIRIINKFLLKDYENIQQELFEAVKFANDTENEVIKYLLKTLLGKLFCDFKQAKRALDLYNGQVNWFAEKKISFGALLSWYLIAEATFITESVKNSITIASQALEIAQNPRINNSYFIVLLKILLAKAYVELSDYETAKINLETAKILAKKYNMNDLLSQVYVLYAQYYTELGSVPSRKQEELLKSAYKKLEGAEKIVNKITHNSFVNELIEEKKLNLAKCCKKYGFSFCEFKN